MIYRTGRDERSLSETSALHKSGIRCRERRFSSGSSNSHALVKVNLMHLSVLWEVQWDWKIIDLGQLCWCWEWCRCDVGGCEVSVCCNLFRFFVKLWKYYLCLPTTSRSAPLSIKGIWLHTASIWCFELGGSASLLPRISCREVSFSIGHLRYF